jgi:transcriptional regulator with XRE-family HTH domain
MAKIDGYQHEDALIGANIKSIRLMREMSRDELADAVGCSGEQIRKYEDGVDSVRAAILKRISEKLSCPLLQLYSAETRRNLTVTPNESEVLHLFKNLPDAEAKAMVKNMVKILAKHFKRTMPKGATS